jgi:hypothetical protein
MGRYVDSLPVLFRALRALPGKHAKAQLRMDEGEAEGVNALETARWGIYCRMASLADGDTLGGLIHTATGWG